MSMHHRIPLPPIRTVITSCNSLTSTSH